MMRIELKEVSIGYDNAVVLKDIDLSFESGQFYCILGANGIGENHFV